MLHRMNYAVIVIILDYRYVHTIQLIHNTFIISLSLISVAIRINSAMR